MAGLGWGRFPSNIHCAPTSGGTLGKAHYEHCSIPPACAVLIELRDRDYVKVIPDYAGLPSTCPLKFELQTLPPPLPQCTVYVSKQSRTMLDFLLHAY